MSRARRARGVPCLPLSVYTAVTPDELDAWLARYALGTHGELTPIAAGIENTTPLQDYLKEESKETAFDIQLEVDLTSMFSSNPLPPLPSSNV